MKSIPSHSGQLMTLPRATFLLLIITFFLNPINFGTSELLQVWQYPTHNLTTTGVDEDGRSRIYTSLNTTENHILVTDEYSGILFERFTLTTPGGSPILPNKIATSGNVGAVAFNRSYIGVFDLSKSGDRVLGDVYPVPLSGLNGMEISSFRQMGNRSHTLYISTELSVYALDVARTQIRLLWIENYEGSGRPEISRLSNDRSQLVNFGVLDPSGLYCQFPISYPLRRRPSPRKPSGGGTAVDPFIVSNVAEFLYMNVSSSSVFHLQNNIDFSAAQYWSNDLGYLAHNFTGTIDGKGFSIFGIHVTNWSLFYFMNNATIRNLEFNFGNITNTSALLAMSSSASRIQNVTVESSNLEIHQDVGNNIGLLIAKSNGDHIQDFGVFQTTINVRSSSSLNAGIVSGYSESSLFENILLSNSHLNFSNMENVGGIVGIVKSSGTIRKSRLNSVAVFDNSTDGTPISGSVGGVVGTLDDSSLSATQFYDSYVGYRTSAMYLGGLVGTVSGSSKVDGCGIDIGDVHLYKINLQENNTVGTLIGTVQDNTVEQVLENTYANTSVLIEPNIQDSVYFGGFVGSAHLNQNATLSSSFVGFEYHCLGSCIEGTVVGFINEVNNFLILEEISQESSIYFDDTRSMFDFLNSEAGYGDNVIGIPQFGSNVSMTGSSAATGMNNLDFNSIWFTRNNQYPGLRTLNFQIILLPVISQGFWRCRPLKANANALGSRKRYTLVGFNNQLQVYTRNSQLFESTSVDSEIGRMSQNFLNESLWIRSVIAITSIGV